MSEGVGLYSAMVKEQLREEAGRRGLPVSGTNEELIHRLEQYDVDNDPLLAEAERENQASTPPERPSPAAKTSTPPTVAPAPPEATEATPVASTGPFRTTFRCDGELSTGVHHENCDRTRERAFHAGLQTRGGAYRIGFEAGDDGHRHAVYEINVRRR